MATIPSAEDQERERAVFDNEEDEGFTEGDDSELDEDEDDEDDTDPEDGPRHPPPPPPNPSPAAPSGADPIPSANPNPNPTNLNPSAPAPASAPPNGAAQAGPLPEVRIEERRALVPFDDSRRLFQRLWTDDDEIKILRGFLEFTTQRGTTFASHQYDTGPFYEQIKRELQLDFTKNQLIEKLRRLKKKFRNAAARIASGREYVFKSPHDQATFDISRKIWSVGLKRPRDSDGEDDLAPPPAAADASVDGSERRLARSRRRTRRRMEETAVEVPVVGVAVEDSNKAILAPSLPVPIPSIIEETVKSCLAPLFKELLSAAIGGAGGPGHGTGIGGLPLNQLLPMSFAGISVNLPATGVGAPNEKWRKQQILELEVYLKRIELLQDQIKSTLEELKSPSGS